ncbi:MAG: DUF523 domain-containing protein [Cellulosilyticaceae bacterium]
MYLVSACLAGFECRYDGKSNTNDKVVELINKGRAIPICPEQLGGLCTPRAACEIVRQHTLEKRVINNCGEDKTYEFELGIKRSVNIAKILKIKKAILKAKSPSCGCGEIYDGTFTGKLIVGNGLLVDALLKEGIQVITEKEL